MIKIDHIKIYLSIILVEGLIAIPFLFSIPSESKSALFLGFSPSRIGLALLFAFLLAILGWLIYRLVTDPTFIRPMLMWLDTQLSKRNLFAYVIAYAFLLTIFSACAVWYLSSPYANETLKTLFLRSRSLIIWAVASLPQVLILLLIEYRSVWKKPGYLSAKTWLKIILIYLLFAAALFHWSVLAFRLPYFSHIHGWFWPFTEKYNLHSLWYGVILVLILISTALVLWIHKFPRACLVFLIFAGWGLQICFGFLEGNAFEVLQKQYLRTGHRHYAEAAVQKNALVPALFNYESFYGKDYYLGTKPPGLLLFYMGNSAIANLIQPEGSTNERFLSLVEYASYVFPILAVLLLPVLYKLCRFFLEPREALIPCLFYIVIPSVLLMPLEPDQFLFPLLFIAAIYLLVAARLKRSFIRACLAGLLLYLALFVTFAFITLAVLFVIWPLVDYWGEGKKRHFREVISLWAGIALVFLILTGISYFVLHYNPITRYMVAIANHRDIKEFQSGIRQVLDAIQLNNVEFADWIGFPVFLLFLLGAAQVVRNSVTHQSTRLDGLLLAFMITYIFLNLGGQTRGEVGHLWIFIVPMVTILSAAGSKAVFEHKRLGMILLVLLQTISVLAVYNLQDY